MLASTAARRGARVVLASVVAAGLLTTHAQAQVQVPVQLPGGSRSSVNITQGVWHWERTQYSNGTVLVSPDPSVYTFALMSGGLVLIQADCNRVSGSYTLNGPLLTIQGGATTLVACPPGSQDTVFLRDLQNVMSYRFDGQQLVLNLRGGAGSMIFSPGPPSSLVGATWRVTSYNNGWEAVVSVLPETMLTVLFGAEGNVRGNAGCNTFSGPYRIAGSSIDIGRLVTTLRACASEPANVQERAFLIALEAATVYELVGDRLTLRDDSGATQVLMVRPSIQPVPMPAPVGMEEVEEMEMGEETLHG